MINPRSKHNVNPRITVKAAARAAGPPLSRSDTLSRYAAILVSPAASAGVSSENCRLAHFASFCTTNRRSCRLFVVVPLEGQEDKNQSSSPSLLRSGPLGPFLRVFVSVCACSREKETPPLSADPCSGTLLRGHTGHLNTAGSSDKETTRTNIFRFCYVLWEGLVGCTATNRECREVAGGESGDGMFQMLHSTVGRGSS